MRPSRLSMMSVGLIAAFALGASVGDFPKTPRIDRDPSPQRRRPGTPDDQDEEKFAADRVAAAQSKRERKAAKRQKEAK